MVVLYLKTREIIEVIGTAKSRAQTELESIKTKPKNITGVTL